jgi:hypothetical protein
LVSDFDKVHFGSLVPSTLIFLGAELSPQCFLCAQLRRTSKVIVLKHDPGSDACEVCWHFQHTMVMPEADSSLSLEFLGWRYLLFLMWYHLFSLAQDDDSWTPFRGQRLPLSMLL